MDRLGLVLVMGAGLVGVAMLVRYQQAAASQDVGYSPDADTPYEPETTFEDDFLNTLTNIPAAVTRALGLWAAPAAYADAIATAEQAYGIPPRLLERQLWQECRWRADIINGRTVSSVGAQGIAQFMPATAREMGIDPLDPFASIDAAGRYMRTLYRKFGNWSEALAAYNWGQGNVDRKGLTAAPREAVNYYTQILADVNAATGSNYA